MRTRLETFGARRPEGPDGLDRVDVTRHGGEPLPAGADRLRIRVGVSLDGGAEANDRHRKYAGGRGSHHDHESLLAHEPPALDSLLPHGNRTAPPPGLTRGSTATPYGLDAAGV